MDSIYFRDNLNDLKKWRYLNRGGSRNIVGQMCRSRLRNDSGRCSAGSTARQLICVRANWNILNSRSISWGGDGFRVCEVGTLEFKYFICEPILAICARTLRNLSAYSDYLHIATKSDIHRIFQLLTPTDLSKILSTK